MLDGPINPCLIPNGNPCRFDARDSEGKLEILFSQGKCVYRAKVDPAERDFRLEAHQVSEYWPESPSSLNVPSQIATVAFTSNGFVTVDDRGQFRIRQIVDNDNSAAKDLSEPLELGKAFNASRIYVNDLHYVVIGGDASEENSSIIFIPRSSGKIHKPTGICDIVFSLDTATINEKHFLVIVSGKTSRSSAATLYVYSESSKEYEFVSSAQLQIPVTCKAQRPCIKIVSDRAIITVGTQLFWFEIFETGIQLIISQEQQTGIVDMIVDDSKVIALKSDGEMVRFIEGSQETLSSGDGKKYSSSSLRGGSGKYGIATKEGISFAFGQDKVRLLGFAVQAVNECQLNEESRKLVAESACYALSPSGSAIAVASKDKRIRIYPKDSIDSKIYDKLRWSSHTSAITALTWLDERTLVSADRNVYIWRIEMTEDASALIISDSLYEPYASIIGAHSDNVSSITPLSSSEFITKTSTDCARKWSCL